MSRPLLAAAAALVFLLSGCAEQTQGNPTPTAGDDPTVDRTITTDPTAPTGPSEPSTGGDEPSALADVDPCELVDQAGLSSLGLTGGEKKTLGEARVCRYRHDGPTLNESFSVSVSIFESLGLADIVGTGIKELPKIGSHDARTFIAPSGSCGVSLGVGDESRVDSTAAGGDQRQACQLVARLAALVEPELP